MEKVRFSLSKHITGYKCSHPGDMSGYYYPADHVQAMAGNDRHVEANPSITTETLDAVYDKLAEARRRIRQLELSGRRVMDLIGVYGIACHVTNPEIHQIINAFEHELDKEAEYWNIAQWEKRK